MYNGDTSTSPNLNRWGNTLLKESWDNWVPNIKLDFEVTPAATACDAQIYSYKYVYYTYWVVL